MLLLLKRVAEFMIPDIDVLIATINLLLSDVLAEST